MAPAPTNHEPDADASDVTDQEQEDWRCAQWLLVKQLRRELEGLCDMLHEAVGELIRWYASGAEVRAIHHRQFQSTVTSARSILSWAEAAVANATTTPPASSRTAADAEPPANVSDRRPLAAEPAAAADRVQTSAPELVEVP